MPQITLTDPVFYKNGEPGHSNVVGFESQVTRVVRFTFVAPETGATDISFHFDDVSKGAGSTIPVRFAITADPTSHQNAGATAPYAGQLSVSLPNYTADGQASVELLPGTTYYLWLFPGQNAWGWYYWPSTGRLNASGISQGIPSVAGESFYLGQEIPITIQSAADCTHQLTFRLGDHTGIIGRDIQTSVTWTPALALASAMPTSQSALCTLICVTYRGGVQVGAAQRVSFPLSVPQSLAPSVIVTYGDTSAALDAFGVLLEKVSKLAVTVEATAHYGATVTSTAVKLDGKTYQGAALPAGNHTLTFTATDSRGLTGQRDFPITVTPYTPPQLEIHASRCRADGTPDDTGDHALVTLTGAVTQLAGNTAALTLTYGRKTVDIPVQVGAFTQTTLIPAHPDSTLSLKGKLTDALKSVSRSMTLSTAYATMDFLSGGKGIAFGTVATKEGFQCAMDAQFAGHITDAAGRPLVGLRELSGALVPGLGIIVHYARIVEVLGAKTLYLQFTCSQMLPKDTVIFSSAELLPGISGTQNLYDVSNGYVLKAGAAYIKTGQDFPANTYAFHWPLY